MYWQVPGKNIVYKSTSEGLEYSLDGGYDWYFSQHSLTEIKRMHPTIEEVKEITYYPNSDGN